MEGTKSLVIFVDVNFFRFVSFSFRVFLAGRNESRDK